MNNKPRTVRDILASLKKDVAEQKPSAYDRMRETEEYKMGYQQGLEQGEWLAHQKILELIEQGFIKKVD